MRVLIAPDSFKESLSARQVAQAIKRGFSKVYPEAIYDLLPLGDGGEGTVASLAHSMELDYHRMEVAGPFGLETTVTYAKKGRLAVFEMAELVGLGKIPLEKRHPLTIHTQGLGQWIRRMVEDGANHLIIGIGGSASHDGGIGMAAGLGVEFYDQEGQVVEAIGANLSAISHFSRERLPVGLNQVRIDLITDVDNPLTGPSGATYVFAGQKGLSADEFARVDQEMATFYGAINPCLLTLSGAGAGGGMAAGLTYFAGAHIQKGIDFVLDQLDFDQRVSQADLVIVGEGQLDRQSLSGKTPIGVARRTPRDTPVIAICGSLKGDLPAFPFENISAAFPIIPRQASLEVTFQQAEDNLVRTAEQVARLLWLGGQGKWK